jgi:hypothetical protein
MTEETIHKAEHSHHEVRIHIDRTPYHSHNPTPAKSLYEIGKVSPGHQLYREVHGNEEDEPIFNDSDEVHLHQDEHFYSTCDPFKGFTIIVNARQKLVHTKKLCFAEIIALAFEAPPTGPNILFTVTFRKAAGKRDEGTLAPGECVQIKNGTIFNVTATDKS